MLTRKRIIASAVGALALTAAAAGSAWAVVNPQDDYYENDKSFSKNLKPYHVMLGGADGRRLVIRFNSNISPFHNDGIGFEKLIGVVGTGLSNGLRWSVKFGKGPNHEARLVIHFAKNFSSKYNGRANLRYYVEYRNKKGKLRVSSARLLFDIGGLNGNVSPS